MTLLEYSNECCKVLIAATNLPVYQDCFYRKHFDNPNKLRQPVRTYRIDSKIVGINAFMRMAIVDNVEKRRYYISQSCDTAVLPEYRGRHIFTKLIKAEEKECQDIEYIIGIPNNNSYPGFIKMGWEIATNLTHYIFLLNPFRLVFGDSILSDIICKAFRDVLKKKAIADCGEITITFEKIFRLTDDEWSDVNNQLKIGVERNNDYIRWKLNENRNSPECMIFRKGYELVGYVIFHIESKWRGKIAKIDDFYQKSGYNICNLFYWALSDKVDMIDNPLVNYRSEDKCIMEQWRMTDYRKLNRGYPGQYLMVSTMMEIDKVKELQFRNIDFDVFLN